MDFEIEGVLIQIIKKPVKHINLRVYPPDAAVKVTVPLRCSEQSIRQSIQNKMPWIHKQRQRIQDMPIPLETNLQTGSVIEYLGKVYLLLIEKSKGPTTLLLKDQLLCCYTQESPARLQAILDHWYKQEMQALIPGLISHWEAIIQVKVKEWGIKKMKTRWGSCNIRAARIWLNLNLMKKPLGCLEYVLVHELVHLLEPSHNKRFYRLMSKFMPNWQDYRSILKH